MDRLVTIKQGHGTPHIQCVIPGEAQCDAADERRDKDRGNQRYTALPRGHVHGAISTSRRISPSSVSVSTISTPLGTQTETARARHISRRPLFRSLTVAGHVPENDALDAVEQYRLDRLVVDGPVQDAPVVANEFVVLDPVGAPLQRAPWETRRIGPAAVSYLQRVLGREARPNGGLVTVTEQVAHGAGRRLHQVRIQVADSALDRLEALHPLAQQVGIRQGLTERHVGHDAEHAEDRQCDQHFDQGKTVSAPRRHCCSPRSG